MISLEFCTTATFRPEIIDRTYKSFTDNLLGIDFKISTLYLNVDPIPVGNTKEVIDVAKKYFGNVVYNIPEEPNFTKAIKWCWSQVKNEYFFNLEDDWELLTRVKIDDLIFKLNRDKQCIAINLRAYSHIRDGRVCLSPGLFLSSWGKKFASALDPRFNPEKQIRYGSGVEIQFLLKSISKQHPTNTDVFIRDIGRDWLNNRQDYGRGAGNSFTTWTKK